MQRTIIVLGLSRTGTSIVSGLLHHMGCNMNPYPNDTVMTPGTSYEDKELQVWSHSNGKLGTLKKIITRRNKKDLWGFKTAAAIGHIVDIIKEFRSPYIVWVWRDPLHGTRSAMAMRKFVGATTGTIEWLMTARTELLLQQAKAAEILKEVPHTHVSFTDLTANAIGVADELRKITGQGSAKDAIRAVYIPGYRSWNAEESS